MPPGADPGDVPTHELRALVAEHAHRAGIHLPIGATHATLGA